jgi:hypothetical protein
MSGVESGLAISRVATQEGVWYSLNIEGQKMPVPRYEQGAALVGSYLYVLGGNYGTSTSAAQSPHRVAF